jgi:hypothetical protein
LNIPCVPLRKRPSSAAIAYASVHSPPLVLQKGSVNSGYLDMKLQQHSQKALGSNGCSGFMALASI